MVFAYRFSSPALLLSTVPPTPENLTLAISPASTLSQLLVRWTIDPPNGVMLTYTIYVTRLDVGNTTLIYTSIITQLNIPSDDLDPGDLDAGERVLVHVSASNSAGEGARSPGVRERTREERKSSQHECETSYFSWQQLVGIVNRPESQNNYCADGAVEAIFTQ